MKTIKHFLFTVAALLCGMSASAHDFEVDGIYYNIKSSTDMTVEVTFRGDSESSYSNEYTGSVTIPENVFFRGKSFRVTSISDWAFYDCSGLTSVKIPNSVTSIGVGAFRDCSGLTSVKIPNSVTSIGSSAFYYCYKLTSVTIPNSVTSIGDRTFYKCKGLTWVPIPNSVTSIGESAFAFCYGLTWVTIPNSVTSIGESAFDNCDNLTSVTIPNSVTSIGDYAFYSCDGLTSVTIPNSVTSIGKSAFYSCDGLTSVTIGNSVTSIGEKAFCDCDNIWSIYIATVNPPSVGSNNFDTTDYTLIDLYVPEESLSAYKNHSVWGKFKFIYTFDATGIEGVEMDNELVNDAPVYNLQGMKMQDAENLPKGIYVKNGKKFVVK